VTGAGTTPTEIRARSSASSPRTPGKKELMMPPVPSRKGTDCMAGLGRPTKQKHEAGKMLKTKGQERAFSKNEAGNILKRSQLQ
jgi:hypothetical protein